jgi:type I restriction enzyme S subunit
VGKIPAHWEVLRNRGLFAQRVEIGYPDLPILEVSLRTGVTVRDFENSKRKQVISQKEKYKRAVHGDIAYNMMRMWQGAVGVAPTDGLISPAYVVARPYAGTNSAYFCYLFTTAAYKAEINKYSRGIVADRNRLYWHDFKQMPSVVPPKEEQDSIVAYLQAQDCRIAKLIRGKQQLIKLLNEQKQTIIHRAVTRGLNPDAPLKPSGVDWLGDVPEHWEIRPLKHWVRINQKTLSESTPENYRFRYIDIGTVGTRRLVHEPEEVTFSQAPSRARRIIRQFDTILSTVRTYLRAVYFFRDKISDLIASTGFAVLSPRFEVNPEFLSLVIQGNAFIDRVTAHSVGIAYPAISESVLSAFHVAIPNTTKEQEQIVEWIKRKIAPIETALEKIEDEVKLMKEYRDRLISDVVTGQIDVRGWQPPTDETFEADDLIQALTEAEQQTESEPEEDREDDGYQ